jgi:hypothetical protein
MGTSGAHGGSPGWSGVGNHTQDWLNGGAEAGTATTSPDGPPGSSPGDPPLPNPQLAALIADLARRLARSGGGGPASGGGGTGGAGGSAGTATGGRGRSTARAASAGGRAAAGAYGLRSGVAATLGELGLSLNELVGLSRHEQARRLLEAATDPSGDVAESELRLANADLILWALNEESEPTPIDLANRWVVEYVWQVWISEAGHIIRSHSATGYNSLRVEQEMRAALEATVSAHSLPDGRPLTARDFEQAIKSALESLERIGRPRR